MKMNKKFGYLLAVLGMLVACLLLLSACGTPRLSEPIGLYVDIDTQTLHWQKVKGASAYSVEVDGTAISTKQNQFSLAKLDAGEYTIRIKAVAGNGDYEDSPVVEYFFVREHETGLVYKATSNNSAYELVSIGSTGGDVVMESTFRGKPVTSIAKGAFRRCNRLNSLVVGEFVQSIGESAFYNCSELQSITLPQGLTSIGKNAFQNCGRLTSIVIPDGVTELPEYTFSLCKSLES
ncbi:MAG: leucine-rich repeat protein, partial [Clostridia bacterium]|nr:leucine-rich repeat protein [Clostridia bacterium]